MINGSLFFILVIALVGAAIGFPSGPAPEKNGADADPIEVEDYPDPQPNPKHNPKFIPKPKKGEGIFRQERESSQEFQIPHPIKPLPGYEQMPIPIRPGKPGVGPIIGRGSLSEPAYQDFQVPHHVKPIPNFEQSPIPVRPGKGPNVGRDALSNPDYQDFQIPHIIVPIPNIEQMPIPVGPNKPIKGPGFVPNINEDPKPVPKVGS